MKWRVLGGDAMRVLTVFIAIIAAATLTFGSSRAVESAGEAKLLLLDQAHAALESGDFTRLAEVTEALKAHYVHEEPNYEYVLFEAALLIERGDKEAAEISLDGYADMLRILSGFAECSEERGMIDENGRMRYSPLAFSRLCGELFGGTYNNPSASGLLRVAEDWSILDRLRVKLYAR